MTAYAMVTITVTDHNTFSAYREHAGAALAKHKAKSFAVSKEGQVIEGDGNAPDVSVILEFPDRVHALAWINDPDLAKVHALRQSAGQSKIILM
ncbi:MAG: DUF1330 domain-containing protein [Cognatishimia sp.]